MGRVNFIQNSFLGGEYSPRVFGRTDLPTYNHGTEELLNMIVQEQGGVNRRPGTRFVRNTEGNGKARVIPFIFSEEDAFVIEMTDDVMKAINNTTFSVSDIDSLPSTASQQDLSESTITGLLTPDGGFAEADIDAVQFAQSGDTIFMVHPDYPPLILSRTGSTFFLRDYLQTGPISEGEIIKSRHAFRDIADNPIGTTMTPSATTGSGITLTASAAYFLATNVGSVFRLDHGTTTGYILITGFTSTTVVTGDVLVNFGATTATEVWQEGAWSDRRGYPRSVAFFRNRLFFGGNAAQPDTIWGTEISNFFNFSPVDASASITDADAITFTVQSQQVNKIQWLASQKNLTIGTLGDEFIAKDLDPTTNVNVTRETSHGSAFTQPVLLSNNLLFVDKSRRFIREFAFDLDGDTFQSTNMSLLSEHLFDKFKRANPTISASAGIKHAVLQTAPTGVIWCVGRDGSMFGVTREISQNIVAWHSHQIGGVSDASSTPAKVESIAVVPDGAGTFDKVWIVVQRYVDGSTVRHLEYIGTDLRANTITANMNGGDANFVDSGKQVTLGGPGKVFTGYTHLEGETVQVVADGFFVGEFVVSAGTITLSNEVGDRTSIIAGLKYTSRIKSLRLESGSLIGSAQGLAKRIDQIAIRFYDSYGAEFGPSSDKLQEIDFRQPDYLMGSPLVLFTGDQIVSFRSGIDTKGQVVIEQKKPLPMNVAALVMRTQVYEQ